MADSPLFERYKNKVTSLTETNDNQELVEVYSYKDRDHFEKLWKFSDPEKPILLVVWDGIPDRESDDEVKTGKYITPIDWAVGFSLHIKKALPETYPDLRILILDEKIERNPDSVSLKFVYQSPDKYVISMPWIRIFSLGQSNVLDRFLENLYSDAVASTNSHKESSRSTSMSAERVEEDKEPTPIVSEQDTPVTESQFFGLNIDVIYENIRRLVDSFRGSVEAVESYPAGDDKAPEPSSDNQTTQSPVPEQDTEICDVPTIPSMKDVLDENHDIDSIKNLWAASLTSPEAGYHHAIANLVGALLLMGGIGEDLHVNALQRLMRSIELLPEESENKDALLAGNNSWINWDNPEWQWRLGELGKTNKKLKLILIDDMFKVGWGEILCRAVGMDYKAPVKDDMKDSLVKISECQAGEDEKIIVKAASSADWIIKKLEGLTNIDKRFEFSLDDGAGQEILFLDLRLYPGNLKSETKKFLTPLLTLAEKFIEGQTKNLPWNGFTVSDEEGEKGELERIKEWMEKDDKKQEDPEYIEALTLLPRILALTDLSLPIILFSSTGRRNITEKLKPYGNIITVFEKPRFTVDIPVDIASQTKHKFLDAMEVAFSVLTGRQICMKVKDLVEKANSYANIIPARINIPKFKHIEIYIDESGTEENTNFSVGGLIMAYPIYSEVNTLSEKLEKSGYYWYSEKENDNNHLSKKPNEQNERKYGACAKTEWTYEDAKGKLLKLCKDSEVYISGICVWGENKHREIKKTRHVLLKDVQGNERYKRLLNTLLELAIYEYIPILMNNRGDKVTLSIFPGTRIKKLSKDDMFSQHNHDDYFGYGYGPKEMNYILGSASIHPIVSNILRSRDDLSQNLTLHHARGVTLQYGVPFEEEGRYGKTMPRNKPQFILKNGGNRKKYYVRNQHYFADQVLEPNGIKNEYEEIFNSGFLTKFDNNIYVLLDARKTILDGNIAEGIIRTARCTGTVVNDKMHCHLLRKIGESLKPEHFDGLKFQNICQLVRLDITIASEPSVPDHSKKDIAGVSDSNKAVNDSEEFGHSVFRNKEADKALNSAILQSSDKTSTEAKKPGETVKKVEKLELKIVVEDISKVFSKAVLYHCRELGGAQRKVLVVSAAVKLSDIDVISKGDIFKATTYTNDSRLYAANLRRIDNKG